MNIDNPERFAALDRASDASLGELLELVVNQTVYAIPSDCIRECRDREPTIGIPDAPRYIEGVIDLRGDDVPVVDLCRRLGASAPGEAAKLVVVVNQRDVALLVDRVGERFTPDRSSLRPAPGFHLEQPGHFVSGLVHDQSRVVLLLNLVALLGGISPALLGETALPPLPAATL